MQQDERDRLRPVDGGLFGGQGSMHAVRLADVLSRTGHSLVISRLG
jgi:hypothetical protein